MLHLHNTLSRQKEKFEPIDANNVRMYVCGPTVYDLAHLGNARPVVVFDVLYRLLKRHYPHATYVRNITDVDDKIMARAKESGETIDMITSRTIKAFHDDMGRIERLAARYRAALHPAYSANDRDDRGPDRQGSRL